jgi:hypothetical protein
MKPNKAIGIVIGNSGWKNTAVKNRLAVLENLFAISNGEPSHNLLNTIINHITYILACS